MSDERQSSRFLSVDRRLLGPAVIASVWIVVAMAAAVQAVALSRLDGRVDLGRAVLGRLAILPVWALATPLILRSARRLPALDATRRPDLTSIAAHIALGSLFIVLSNLVIRIPLAFAATGGVSAMVRSTAQGVAEYYPPALIVYGVIVAIGHFLYPPPAAIGASSVEIPVSPDSSAPSAVAAMDGHITVRQWNRVHLVRVEDIDFVEAEDNYVVVHAASRSYKGRDRISEVESQLDSRRFVRIHRSTIVHVAKIREVQPLTHGDHAVILRDGKVLRVARSRKQALGQALGVEL
jgi:two-component system LytT family response regulator